jgi:hypothetical protein
MAELLAHKRSVQEAWESGDLTVDTVWYVLDQYVDRWGRFDNRINDVDLRRELAGLLVKHAAQRLRPAFEEAGKVAPVSVTKTPLVPVSVRTWVADYLRSVRDERCLVLYEGILRDLDARPDQKAIMQSWSWVHQPGNLAESYMQFWRWKEAAQVWERAAEYSSNSAWLSDAKLEAIRCYLWTKEATGSRRAKELFAEVMELGSDEFMQLGIWSVIGALLLDGKYVEARALLQLPALQKQDAKPVGIVISRFLGLTYYLSRDFVNARRYFQSAVVQYQTLGHTDAPWVRTAYGSARDALFYIDRWQENPVICNPMQIDVSVEQGKKNDIRQEVVVSSLAPENLEITSSDPRVKVTQKGEWELRVDFLSYERKIQIEIPASASEKSFDATFTLLSTGRHGGKLEVPIYVEIEEPVTDNDVWDE